MRRRMAPDKRFARLMKKLLRRGVSRPDAAKLIELRHPTLRQRCCQLISLRDQVQAHRRDSHNEQKK
jgi:hypothetical protein